VEGVMAEGQAAAKRPDLKIQSEPPQPQPALHFSREEVAKHRSAGDCWIIVDDGVYDVTHWLAVHPGRAGPILGVAGGDATDIFWRLVLALLPTFLRLPIVHAA
jgi:cytochrome b involved in lipid metabolism